MIRVMLVDDEENALDILEILLREIGNVTVMGRYMNPLQAIEALELEQVDAVFLDIQMSGLTGMEAARLIRAKKPHIQIVFTTAYSEYAVEAFEIHSADYLLKPFTKERLQNSVLRLAQTQSDQHNAANVSQPTWVQSLGGFHIHTEKGALSWRTNKEKELCAFLFHHSGKAVDAASIIEAVWPAYHVDKAKGYLYTCISFLRKNFQANHIQASVVKAEKGYALHANGLMIDRIEFEETLEHAIMGEPDKAMYDRMNTLYKGEYLKGCDFPWADWKRDSLLEKYIHTLRSMYRHFMKKGSVSLAVDSLQRVLALSPDSEQDGRELIKLYINTGYRSNALKVYRQLDEAVRINLGVELEEDTMRLYRELIANG
ncbi:response regulator [Aneurinibacillus sp. BA2021]|nr:response regulator [Aneurinibacillus sp. BA2021]